MNGPWDIVISDYRMPQFSGLAALKLVREHSTDLPFNVDGAVFRIAFKGGIAVFPEAGIDADSLLRNAEAALKIDRSFVIDMTSGPESLALVFTIVTLAHAMKLKAVAEGVGTEEQLRLLKSLHCDQMQGDLFSKPVPSEILEANYLAASRMVREPRQCWRLAG